MDLKLILCFAFVYSFGLVNGQVVFEKYVISDISDGIFRPEDIAIGDIDGDGLDDLVTCSGNGKILWCRNNGIGGFEEAQIVNEFLGSLSRVVIADLNEDGHLDVISDGGDGILWHENNNGSGTFAWERTIGPGQVEDFGDLDGDGDLDIISSSFNSQSVVWYENLNGSINFSDPQIIDGSQWVLYTSLEDLDNDGDLDVVGSPFEFGGGDAELIWYENSNGLGNFNGPVTILEPPFTVGTDLKFADIDNDEIKDLCSKTSDNRISWRKKGLEFNDFGLLNTIDNPDEDIRNFILTDSDTDGDIDVYTFIEENVFLQKNINGLGIFTNPVLTSQNKKNLNSLKFSDVDNDNNVELFYASADRNEIGWEKKIDGSEVFGLTQYPIPPYPDFPNSLYPNDLDDDGDLDIICASSDDNKISWYENIDGAGTFSNERLINNCATEADYVLSADMDGDGDQDVIASLGDIAGPGYIVWYENVDGVGYSWEPDTAFTRNGSIYGIEVADFDSDGDMDITGVSSSLSDRHFWIENTNGQGAFGEPKSISLSQGLAYSLNAADLDNDGDMDLIGGGPLSTFWVENMDGLGNFSEGQLLPQQDFIDFVQTADLDGDGDLDILTAAGEAQKLCWYENTDGEGSFGSKQIISSTVKDILSIQTEDIDSDGDLDIITGASGTSTYRVIYFENLNGLGDFGTEQMVFQQILSFGAPFVASGDFDGDSDADIVAAESERDRISWFENKGILFNEIFGQVLLDLDGGGCESSSNPVSDLLITNDNNNPVFSSTNGYFQFIEQLGVFTTSVITPDFYDLTPSEYVSEFSDYGIIDTANFCLTPNQTVDDLNIVVLPITEVRPGFETKYKVVIRNAGTTTLSGPVVFQFDSNALTFLSSSDPNLILNSNSLNYSFQNLAPFSKHEIDLSFTVAAPPIVNIDDELTVIASIDFSFNDVNEEDNIFILEQQVIGSFDPNDISVLEGPEIYLEEAGNFLHYLIRFQNTGTASAINVRIENLIDPNLNWETLQLDSYSHPNITSIINENKIVFNFDNINLPDSTTNEEASNGYIAYKIKPVNSVGIGDQFLNEADIYFDFNEPIQTNTVITEIVIFSNTSENEYQDLEIYPIPTNDFLNVKSTIALDNIFIFDSYGKMVHEASNLSKIDLNFLPIGIYYCKIIDKNNKITIRKIIKY